MGITLALHNTSVRSAIKETRGQSAILAELMEKLKLQAEKQHEQLKEKMTTTGIEGTTEKTRRRTKNLTGTASAAKGTYKRTVTETKGTTTTPYGETVAQW